MTEKYPITIRQSKETNADFKIFNISLEQMHLVTPSIFDLFTFNNAGYFLKLLKNFKANNQACFMLFRALTWHEPGSGGARREDIREILDLSSSYLTVFKSEPGESRLIKQLGEEIHFVMLKNDVLPKVERMITWIDSKGTWCYFIFDLPENKDAIFSKIERLYRQNELKNQKKLLSLCLDIIKFGSQGLWAEYELEIFTNRYNASQIKDLILNSVDKEKFEVIAK